MIIAAYFVLSYRAAGEVSRLIECFHVCLSVKLHSGPPPVALMKKFFVLLFALF